MANRLGRLGMFGTCHSSMRGACPLGVAAGRGRRGQHPAQLRKIEPMARTLGLAGNRAVRGYATRANTTPIGQESR